MAKRKRARVSPPRVLVTVEEETNEPVEAEEVRPIRNRAERRALMRQLTSRRSRNGKRSDTPGAVSRVR
jgi:hypothetical protein